MSSKLSLKSKKKNKIYYNFFYIFSLLYVAYCIINLGPAWDSFFYIDLGKDRLDYLLSLGLNKVDFNYWEQWFAGIYITIVAFILKIFPSQFELEVFYGINFIFSILTTVGVYKLIKFLFNQQIGFITAVIFLYYSIFFGHALINDRDTITVFCNIWITYYVLRYFQFNLSKNKKYIIYISLLLAIGTGIRFHFIATLIPLTMLTIYYFYNLTKKNKILFLYDFFKIILLSTFIIFIFWVPAHENLLTKPQEIIKVLLERVFGWPAILINGKIYESNNYPITYILENLFFKSPEYIIFLYSIFIIFFFSLRKFFKKNIINFDIKLAFVLINILFPTFLLFIFDVRVYDGLRLFLYILPYFLAIPGIVFYYLIVKANNFYYKLLLSVSVILSFYYLINFFLITPYHYTYLNFFAGKFSDAHEKFENDYWGISLKELSKKISNDERLISKKFIKFSVCGVSKKMTKYNLNKHAPKINYKIVRNEENPDYVILTNRLTKISDNQENKYSTCFNYHKGDNILQVERKNLALSVLKKHK